MSARRLSSKECAQLPLLEQDRAIRQMAQEAPGPACGHDRGQRFYRAGQRYEAAVARWYRPSGQAWSQRFFARDLVALMARSLLRSLVNEFVSVVTCPPAELSWAQWPSRIRYILLTRGGA